MKALRVAAVGLAVLVLLVVAGVGGVAAWLHGESGRRWLAATIEGAVASPDSRLTLGAIEGSLPFDVSIARVEMADTRGTWLTLEGLRVALTPSALLARRVQIDTLEAARVTIARAPVVTQPPPAQPAAAAPSASPLPDLPVGVRLDRLAVTELRLGEALLGEAATLRVEGAAALGASRGALDGRLSVVRTDGAPGQADLSVAFDPAGNSLALSVKAAEPGGGVIARALAIPGLPPVTLALDGMGALDDWAGRLTARAGDAVTLGAEATVKATAEGHAVTLTAGGMSRSWPGRRRRRWLGHGPPCRRRCWSRRTVG